MRSSGYTSYFNSQQGYLSNSRVQNALLVGGTAANPVCLSGPPCVPYNIFSDGGVTPAALSYLDTGGTISGDTQEQVVSANITGDLSRYGLKSPFAGTGLGVNFGAEYRREALTYAPDQIISSGDLLGGSGASPAVSGAFDVKEVFGEARLPLAQDLPFIKDLTFEGGYRFSQYSSSGGTSAYKIALGVFTNKRLQVPRLLPTRQPRAQRQRTLYAGTGYSNRPVHGRSVRAGR